MKKEKLALKTKSLTEEYEFIKAIDEDNTSSSIWAEQPKSQRRWSTHSTLPPLAAASSPWKQVKAAGTADRKIPAVAVAVAELKAPLEAVAGLSKNSGWAWLASWKRTRAWVSSEISASDLVKRSAELNVEGAVEDRINLIIGSKQRNVAGDRCPLLWLPHAHGFSHVLWILSWEWLEIKEGLGICSLINNDVGIVVGRGIIRVIDNNNRCEKELQFILSNKDEK